MVYFRFENSTINWIHISCDDFINNFVSKIRRSKIKELKATNNSLVGGEN